MRAYRGYGGRSEDEAFLYPERDMLFASSDPHTAATYANSARNGDPVLSRCGISTQVLRHAVLKRPRPTRSIVVPNAEDLIKSDGRWSRHRRRRLFEPAQ